MSDGITDMEKDHRRAESYDDFCFVLAEHLNEPTDEKKDALADSAACWDAVPRRYWNGRTELAKGLDKWLNNLCGRDTVAWASLLLSTQDSCCFRAHEKWKCSLYDKLKSLSPFAGKLFAIVDYGSGFATIRGEIQKLLDACVSSKGFCTYDCDKYAIIFDEKPVPSDVIWIRSGCWDSSGAYRTPNKEERNKRLAFYHENNRSHS